MAGRVLTFLRRIIVPAQAPEPPPIIKAAPGSYALFMDEDEQTVLYAKPWPYTGVPVDDRTNTSQWMIDGRCFGPSRRDEQGNWIFRRCRN